MTPPVTSPSPLATQTVAFVLVSYRPDEPAGMERADSAEHVGATTQVKTEVPMRVPLGVDAQGKNPTGGAWINFNVRFYLIALVFVIFEVEVAFIYPVASVYLDWVRRGQRFFALGEILIFLLILFVGLIYVWVKRDLEWIKQVLD